MNLQDCNPFLREVQIQAAVLEGADLRFAYDHRIFFILEGEGELILKDAVLALKPNDLVYICPQIGYYFKGRLRVVVVNFDLTRASAHRTDPVCPVPAEVFDPAALFDGTVLAGTEQPILFREQRGLREEMVLLADRFCSSDPFADAATSGMLKKMLAELFAPKKEQNLVRLVERYIELHAAEIENNAQIAEEFGYHPVYIATLFREKTGRSLHRAVLERRLALACQYLARTEQSVEEIAYECGFSSRSHFCTMFKREMGCSPKNYVKKIEQAL